MFTTSGVNYDNFGSDKLFAAGRFNFQSTSIAVAGRTEFLIPNQITMPQINSRNYLMYVGIHSAFLSIIPTANPQIEGYVYYQDNNGYEHTLAAIFQNITSRFLVPTVANHLISEAPFADSAPGTLGRIVLDVSFLSGGSSFFLFGSVNLMYLLRQATYKKPDAEKHQAECGCVGCNPISLV